jgi:hypothetical protein
MDQLQAALRLLSEQPDGEHERERALSPLDRVLMIAAIMFAIAFCIAAPVVLSWFRH